MILLDHTDYQVAAKRQVMHREAEIERLLEAQETLLTIELAGPGATASSPSASRSSFR
jgi:hypothetical protein